MSSTDGDVTFEEWCKQQYGHRADEMQHYISQNFEAFMKHAAISWLAGFREIDDGRYSNEDAYETGSALRYMVDSTIEGAGGIDNIDFEEVTIQ